jgi:hypothetical protein
MANVTARAYYTIQLTFNPSPSQKKHTFGMHVDGRLQQGPGQSSASGRASISIFDGAHTVGDTKSASDSGQVSFTLVKQIALQGVTTVWLSEGMDAGAIVYSQDGDSSPSADFGHSARTFVQLAPGWTFTSGSGDFLSYQIRVLQSGRCLDADTGSIGGNGTKVQLWDCWGGQNQSWSVNSDGTIVNLQSGRCLDADTGSIGSNGTKVQLWDCWGGQNQKWVWPGFAPSTGPSGSDNHNVQSGRCLDADTGPIDSDGTNVQLWDCGGGQNQVWAH